MNFELLPNEILIQCFEYLTPLEIFYSFDQLNFRLYKLIRNIPLYLDFQNVCKAKFDQFCKKILANAGIKRQIYSLKLSNKYTCGQIRLFLEFFSLKDFSHLQSLTLIDVKHNNLDKLKSMLPTIDKLYCFRLFDTAIGLKEIFTAIPTSKLRILTIPNLLSNFKPIDKTISIISLTLSDCCLKDLYQILENAPMLKYLNVENISKSYYLTSDNQYHRAIHLRQLILMRFQPEFQDFELFITQTPNLKSLTISISNDINTVDASHWEYLIKSSLHRLNTFKFKFDYYNANNNSEIRELFNQFQTDFWQKQHHWYTEYEIQDHHGLIYTIPYMSNRYEITINHIKDSNKSNVFDNVINLTIHPEAALGKFQYQFSNVTSLKFIGTTFPQHPTDYTLLKEQYFLSLKMMVNLSHLKHLDISFIFYFKTSSVLLQILKEAPQLSSIVIAPQSLLSLLANDELCIYFNQLVRELDVSGCSAGLFDSTNTIKKFCKVFSNVEQLIYSIDQRIDFFFLLNHLSLLSSMEICVPAYCSNHFISWFEKDARKLNANFHIEELTMDENIYDVDDRGFSIWISR